MEIAITNNTVHILNKIKQYTFHKLKKSYVLVQAMLDYLNGTSFYQGEQFEGFTLCCSFVQYVITGKSADSLLSLGKSVTFYINSYQRLCMMVLVEMTSL